MSNVEIDPVPLQQLESISFKATKVLALAVFAAHEILPFVSIRNAGTIMAITGTSLVGIGAVDTIRRRRAFRPVKKGHS